MVGGRVPQSVSHDLVTSSKLTSFHNSECDCNPFQKDRQSWTTRSPNGKDETSMKFSFEFVIELFSHCRCGVELPLLELL